MSVLSSLAEHPWAYPAFQVVHLVGMSLLLGNLVLLESDRQGKPTLAPPRAWTFPLLDAATGLCADSHRASRLVGF
ncbi:MAG: hypothetical protein EB114_11390 [Betaproteobacteria bacterium]|nr:hypothetical protein [Betaproteobacteria bacterium]